ncbi:MAG: hypothetical protein U0T56_12680 [Ferruginibacter sp.]
MIRFRTPRLPVWASLLILAGSLAMIVWYFVIWPVRLSRKGHLIQQQGIVSRMYETNA